MASFPVYETIFDHLAERLPVSLCAMMHRIEATGLSTRADWWLCQDSHQGFYEMALDFWRYDYPPQIREQICRGLLTELACPAARTALEQVTRLMRRHLGLLQSPVNTMSLAVHETGVKDVKFYFDLHRYQEFRDGDRITSHPPADETIILDLLGALGTDLGTPPIARHTHDLLRPYNLRPVLIGASFDPVNPARRRMTLYYGLEDLPLAERDRIIEWLADQFDAANGPGWHGLHQQIRAIGGLPMSLAAYVGTAQGMDLKIDYRILPTSPPTATDRLRGLQDLCAALSTRLPEPPILPACLGLNITPQGAQRLKIYYV